MVPVLISIIITQLDNASADVPHCELALQKSEVNIQLPGGSITLNDPFSLSDNCKDQLFTQSFPSGSCDLSLYPEAGSNAYARPELTREASLVALDRIATANSIQDLGIPEVLHNSVVDITTYKSIAALIGGRLFDKVDRTCQAVRAVPSKQPLADKVLDYSLIYRIRELLRAAEPQKLIFWSDIIISAVAALPRPDTRNFVQSLFNNHNTFVISSWIRDLQLSLLKEDTAKPPPTITPPPTTLSTTTLPPTQPKPSASPDVGSGHDPRSEEDQGQEEEVHQTGPETEPASQEDLEKAEERRKYAHYLVGVSEDKIQDTIAKVKQLEALGVEIQVGFDPGDHRNVDPQFRHNSILNRLDQRDGGQGAGHSDENLEQTQTEAIQSLDRRLAVLQQQLSDHKLTTVQRLEQLTTSVNRLSKNQATSLDASGAGLRSRMSGLSTQMTKLRTCCNDRLELNRPNPSNKLSSRHAFYSLENLSRIYGFLEKFISSYKIYKASVVPFLRGRRSPVDVEELDVQEDLQAGNSGKKEKNSAKQGRRGAKLFKKLTRSGDIFYDQTLSMAAINQVLEALNNYDKVVERYHENSKRFVPTDYVKTANEIFGTTPEITKSVTKAGASLYDKILTTVRKKYPNLSSCCLVSYVAIAITGLLTLFAAIASCCLLCCERQSPKSCCKTREDFCNDSDCGCCGRLERPRADRMDVTRPQPDRRDYRPTMTAPPQPPYNQPPLDPQFSRQRDATMSSHLDTELQQPLVPSNEIKDWSTLRQAPRQASTNL